MTVCARTGGADHNDNPQQMIVRLYHPLPYQSRQTIRVRLCFERNFPSTFSEGGTEYERKPNFELRDKEGIRFPTPCAACGMSGFKDAHPVCGGLCRHLFYRGPGPLRLHRVCGDPR